MLALRHGGSAPYSEDGRLKHTWDRVCDAIGLISCILPSSTFARVADDVVDDLLQEQKMPRKSKKLGANSCLHNWRS